VSNKTLALIALTVVMMVVLAGCGGATTAAPAATQAPAATEAPAATAEPAATEEPAPEATEAPLSGDVVVDGSSTVYPLTVAVAEEFALIHPDVRVSVGLSGTGGGFAKFCVGETDISNASRAIKQSEIDACTANGIEYVELLVGFDGLSVVVNPENDWVQGLTIEQLGQLFRPDAENNVDRWSDLDPTWPDEPISFYVPDPDSGTRDYFIEAILEKGLELPEELLDVRTDDQTTFSSDDNVLLDGVANDRYAIGFFGFAYVVENPGTVRTVAIENQDGQFVEPTFETIADGSYSPLSRPLYIYPNVQSLREKPQVAEFVRFYLSPDGAAALIREVGYVEPPAGTYEAGLEAVEAILMGQ
jgi:phosphate transport system substrate-binding protein